MHYLHTMVRIANIDSALDFYCTKLGLSEVSRYESSEGRYTNIFLSAPGDTASVEERRAPLLELTYNWPSEDGTSETYSDGRNFGHLAFAVENIYDTCAKLMAEGVTINRPPRDGRMAFIKSPDGISIELLQIGDALPPAEPWQLLDNNGNW